jgi:serine/threonine protein kinase
LTTTRGTIGYLATKWFSRLPNTSKIDVYSFGVMLFELISGRRNALLSEADIYRFLLSMLGSNPLMEMKITFWIID